MTDSKESVTFKTLAPLLKIHMLVNQVPFLAGDPGIGKSATLKQLAKDIGTKAFILSVNQLGTREDLTGARSMMDEESKTYRQVFFPHAIIQDAIDYAKNHPDETPILFLDEINRTSTDVTSAIMAIITERRVGTTPLPTNIRLVAAGNDDGNVNVMDLASNSRIQIYHVVPDIDSYFAAQPDLNFYIKQLLSKKPEYLVQIPSANMDVDSDTDDDSDDNSLDDLFDGDTMKQITVPRTLSYLSNFLNAAGLDGHTMPTDIDKIYNPMEPYTSPLYYAIHATIGTTEASEALFANISTSLETIGSNGTPTANINVKVPAPKQEILDAMYNDIETDDDVDAMFNDPNLTINNFVDTFLTLMQPANYKKLNFTVSMARYYKDLVALDGIQQNATVIDTFNKTFAKLMQANKVTKQVLDIIKSENDGFSTRMQLLITALS